MGRRKEKVPGRIEGKQTGIDHEEQSRKIKRILAIFIFCIAFLLFLNSIGNDFVFDDRIVVERNELVKDPSQITRIFSTPYHYGYRGANTGLYRPVTILSFAVNYAVSGFSKHSFHIVNIFLHSLVSLFIFLLLLEIDGRISLAFASSLFFASHPIHTEVVSNIAGRAELLSSLFFIIAFVFLIKSRRSNGSERALFFSLSLISFLVSLLSKESAIVFPVVIIAYEMIMRRKDAGKGSATRSIIVPTLYFVGIATFYLVIRLLVLGTLAGGAMDFPIENPLTQTGFFGRVLGATKVLGNYLWLLLVPLRLSADYSYDQIKIPQSIFDLSVIVPLIIVAAFIFIFIRAFKRSPITAFAIAFFPITFSIVSNYFFPIGTIMGERLMYLPSLSFCIVLGLVIITLGKREEGKGKTAFGGWRAGWRLFTRYQMLLLCVITALYCARTLARNLDWRNEYTVFSSAERVSPESVKILNNLGVALQKRKMHGEAIERFKKALTIYPEHQNARNNLAQVYLSIGDMENAEREITLLLDKHEDFAAGHLTHAEILRKQGKLGEALTAIKKAIVERPDFPEAQDLFGRILLEMGDFAEAETVLKQVIEKEPASVIYYTDLGLLYMAMNRFPEAIDRFRKAYELDPNNATTMSNLGTAYRSMGKYEEALKCFREALEIAPQNDSIRYNLALTLLDQEEYEMAAGELRKIAEKEPVNPQALTKLGSALLSLEDPDAAIGFLSRALRSDPYLEEAYALRARGYFLSGMYDEALKDYSMVIELNPQSVAAWNNRGTIHAIQRKYDLARSDWEEALKLAPEQKEIRLNLEKLKSVSKEDF